MHRIRVWLLRRWLSWRRETDDLPYRPSEKGDPNTWYSLGRDGGAPSIYTICCGCALAHRIEVKHGHVRFMGVSPEHQARALMDYERMFGSKPAPMNWNASVLAHLDKLSEPPC